MTINHIHEGWQSLGPRYTTEPWTLEICIYSKLIAAQKQLLELASNYTETSKMTIHYTMTMLPGTK